MPTILFKAFSRHLKQHPWQLGLAVLGIMVGVAVIVAIRLTQHSAFEAFDAATRTTIGHASHRLIGHRGWIRNESFRRIGMLFPEIPMTPVLSRRVALPEHDRRNMELLGIDPISVKQIAKDGSDDRVLFDPAELIAEPLTAVINQATANELGVVVG